MDKTWGVPYHPLKSVYRIKSVYLGLYKSYPLFLGGCKSKGDMEDGWKQLDLHESHLNVLFLSQH